MSRGKLYLLVGPMAVGKKSIMGEITKLENFQKLVQCTSRPKKANEKDGIDFHFLTANDFVTGTQTGEFVHFDFVNSIDYYGIRRQDVENIISTGKDLIGITDLKGAINTKKALDLDVCSIFIHPEELGHVIQRIKAKKELTSDEIIKITEATRNQMKKSMYCDLAFMNFNDDMKRCLQNIVIAMSRIKNNSLILTKDRMKNVELEYLEI